MSVRSTAAGPVEYRYNGDAPQWDGTTSLDGKTLLVHAEQGLGDTIMFFRYLEHLPDLAENILVAVQKPLAPWLAGQAAGFEVISLDAMSEGECTAADYQCPMMSLPHLVGDRLRDAEVRSPYLSAPADAVSKWHGRLGPGQRPRIGFAFRGNPDHQNDGNRSLDLDLFLTALPGGAESTFSGST